MSNYAYLLVAVDVPGQVAGVYSTRGSAEVAKRNCPFETKIMPGVPIDQDLWTKGGEPQVCCCGHVSNVHRTFTQGSSYGRLGCDECTCRELCFDSRYWKGTD